MILKTDNKFRAVLTIFGKDKILELHFDGLNEQRMHIDVKIIPNNRHKVNDISFISDLMNLKSAYEHYLKDLLEKLLLAKMMGVI